MNIKKVGIIASLILSVAFFSCDRGPVYESYQKIKNSTWDRFDIRQFEIPVEKEAMICDISIVVRCSESFQYDELPFYVIMTTPSGEERMREVTVPVREKGKLILDPETAKTESRLVLWKGINMADKGKCKFTFENMIPKIQTEGIEEIGIVVMKTK